DATADGNDRAAAIGARAYERFVDARDRLEVLVALAVGNQDRLGAGRDMLQLRAVQPPDHGTRDDEAPLADAVLIQQRGELLGDAVADPDCGGAGAGEQLPALLDEN